MIILKNKTFTRAEKEAIKELLLKTRNLTKLPSGTNLKRGHSQRLGNMAADLKEWVHTGKRPDTENMKEVLNQWGLPKGAAVTDKVIDKYSNKRAIARLERMRNNGVNGFGPRVDWGKVDKNIERYYKGCISNCDRLKVKESDIARLDRENKKGNAALNKKLKRQLRAENILQVNLPSGEIHGTIYGRRSSNGNILPVDPSSIGVDVNNGIISRYRYIRPSHMIGSNAVILTPKNAHPSSGFHELGHYKFCKTPAGKRTILAEFKENNPDRLKNHVLARKISGNIEDASSGLLNLADENGASEQAMIGLIKNGASKEKLRESRDILKKCGETYLGKVREDLLTNSIHPTFSKETTKEYFLR